MVAKDEKRNTWYVRIKVTDASGKKREIWKRGFPTKREASEFEHEQKRINEGSTNMSFKSFCESVFLPDMKLRVKESTYRNYEGIVIRDLVPYFGQFGLESITTSMVRAWQNKELVEDGRYNRPRTTVYLQNAHKMLSMVFLYAKKFYGLKENPAELVGNFRKKENKEMKFWTLEEYKKFSNVIAYEKPVIAIAIDVLYWTGLRRGEMLALTKTDLDFAKNEITINKTKFREPGGKFKLTPPKTLGSYRKVMMPKFLSDKLKEYIDSKPDMDDKDFVFPISETQLGLAISKYAVVAGVKPIRVHDLRHSHVSLLIHQGYSAVAIGKRVGHTSQSITLRYSHMFPHVQNDIANTLDSLNKESQETSDD